MPSPGESNFGRQLSSCLRCRSRRSELYPQYLSNQGNCCRREGAAHIRKFNPSKCFPKLPSQKINMNHFHFYFCFQFPISLKQVGRSNFASSAHSNRIQLILLSLLIHELIAKDFLRCWTAHKVTKDTTSFLAPRGKRTSVKSMLKEEATDPN